MELTQTFVSVKNISFQYRGTFLESVDFQTGNGQKSSPLQFQYYKFIFNILNKYLTTNENEKMKIDLPIV